MLNFDVTVDVCADWAAAVGAIVGAGVVVVVTAAQLAWIEQLPAGQPVTVCFVSYSQPQCPWWQTVFGPLQQLAAPVKY